MSVLALACAWSSSAWAQWTEEVLFTDANFDLDVTSVALVSVGDGFGVAFSYRSHSSGAGTVAAVHYKPYTDTPSATRTVTTSISSAINPQVSAAEADDGLLHVAYTRAPSNYCVYEFGAISEAIVDSSTTPAGLTGSTVWDPDFYTEGCFKLGKKSFVYDPIDDELMVCFTRAVWYPPYSSTYTIDAVACKKRDAAGSWPSTFALTASNASDVDHPWVTFDHVTGQDRVVWEVGTDSNVHMGYPGSPPTFDYLLPIGTSPGDQLNPTIAVDPNDALLAAFGGSNNIYFTQCALGDADDCASSANWLTSMFVEQVDPSGVVAKFPDLYTYDGKYWVEYLDDTADRTVVARKCFAETAWQRETPNGGSNADDTDRFGTSQIGHAKNASPSRKYIGVVSRRLIDTVFPNTHELVLYWRRVDNIGETCSNGIDDDCDGLVDEAGCT